MTKSEDIRTFPRDREESQLYTEFISSLKNYRKSCHNLTELLKKVIKSNNGENHESST